MPSLHRYFPAGFILALGLEPTMMATTWVSRWEQLSRQGEFQRQIGNLTTALQRTTNRYNELLLAIGDFYAANANDITDEAFSRFVQRAVQTYPGIQALEWAPLVLHGDRAAYEAWLQTLTERWSQTGPSGPSQLGITERSATGILRPAAERSSYVPVTFLEPWQTNEVALGYDLASDDTRRIALEQARDTGALAATGRIQLVQETADNQYSFLVFLPIYHQPATTPRARRQQLKGYILGVFRVADVVEESLSDLDHEIDFWILDQTARADEKLLGFYDGDTQTVLPDGDEARKWSEPEGKSSGWLRSTSLCPTPLECSQTLAVGQRQWHLLFLPPSYSPPPWAALATVLIGLLMTAILLIYLSRWQSELERTRELSNLKLRLFSMASHELRTPLSVISISAQSLSANRDALTPQQQMNTVDRIQAAARRMGQLVDDILTLTRAEAGKLQVNPEIVELDPFCRQVFDQIQPQVDQRLSLSGNAIHTKIYLDKKLLHSILVNLLSNAVKYSAADSLIRLVVTAKSDILEFQVIDQGIGIPLTAQQNLFKAFYRGANVGSVPGVGLGLAVVKTCVELQDGCLTVHSQPGRGTCITVMLPKIE
ncbi:Two-component sensor histidine kinase [Halomicronema hongdechloris C2206]|uniref:histidine kinase n=1 Tax=Halomicronema hongdechloris C2206 TaxID=1641165 RepID=A0A1Z3HGC3_9CYAN|nr:CHASE domain-containing protein [Halomicronema hongdechloris]ASC69315.1 Two-component sensor histidine kinase [Halomicronema hongdechloris C2206]